MEDNRVISNVGCISNMTLTLRFLSRLTKQSIDEIKLNSLIETDKTIYMNMDKIENNSNNASIKLVPISILTPDKEKVYLFFRRRNITSCKVEMFWVGTKVGTLKTLSFNINNESFITNKTLYDVYDLLLDKEVWEDLSSQCPYNRLRLYLNFELKFLISYLKKNNGLIFNKDKSKIVFNSRLFSKYGDYIILIGDCIKSNVYRNIQILNSDISLSKLGFPPNLNLEPPQLFCDNTFIFNAEYKDFHLIDYGRLQHILHDRINRFRDLKDNIKDLDLILSVKNSIEFSILQSKINPNYVHPMYSVEYNAIQFLIPIYTEFSNNNKPQCAMMIRKNSSGIWNLQTILDMDTAYMSARIIKKPDNSWLILGGE